VLSREVQRRATRGQHPQGGTRPEELSDQRGSWEHVFEVIQDQEETLAGEVRHQGVTQGLLGPFSDAQPLRDRGRDEGRINQWRQRDEDHAIGKLQRDLLRVGECEARLAGASRSGQGEEPDHGLSQESSHRHDFLFPTDQGGEGNRQTGMKITSLLPRACGCRTPCGRHQRGAIGGGEGEGIQQELQRVLAREPMGAALQIADATGADPGPFGELLLGQPRGDPVAP
jgi:hypothetical protein